MFHRLPLCLHITLALGLLASSNLTARCAPGPQTSPLQVVPAAIDLGSRAPAAQVESSTWLINTGTESVRVVGAKGGCGCIDLSKFEACDIAAQRAIKVPFTIKAPKKDGEHKSTHINFKLAGGSVVQLALSMTALEAAPPRAPEAAPTRAALEAAPAKLTLSGMAPEEQRNVSLWWINTSDRAVETLVARAGCGCTTIAGFEPGSLLPGQALKLDLTVKAPKQAGKRTKWIYVSLADGTLAKAPFEVECVEKLAAGR